MKPEASMRKQIPKLIALGGSIATLVGVASCRPEAPPTIASAPPPPGGTSPAQAPAPVSPSTPTPLPGGERGGARSETVIATVRGEEANLSAGLPGTVTDVRVRMGQTVAKDEVLVTLDDRDIQRQIDLAREQATAAAATAAKARKGRDLKSGELQIQVGTAEQQVKAAQINLEKAQAGLTGADTVSRADVDRAQAAVSAAQAALAKAKKGPAPEEIRRLEIQLEHARKGREDTAKNLQTTRHLVTERAVPRMQFEQAQSRFDQADAQVRQLEQSLKQAKAGAAPEDLRAAEAQVEQARAGVTQTQAGATLKTTAGQKDVEAAALQLESAMRGVELAKRAREQLTLLDEDVRMAESQLAQANTNLRRAMEQKQNTRLKSPIAGVVSSVSVNAGEVAGPGRPLVTVSSTRNLHLEASVPVRLVEEFRAGRRVTVELDSTRGRQFTGVVRDVSLVANPDQRSYPARIDLARPPAGLRPGSRARVIVPARGARGARAAE